MKLFSATQVKKWDQFTIQNEPISSIDLMERAAEAFVNQFCQLFKDLNQPIYIFCGPGNNGGDGLAIGRILHHLGYDISIFLCEISPKKSADFLINLERLPNFDTVRLSSIDKNSSFPIIPNKGIIIDAIFGSGLNRPIDTYWSQLLVHLNLSPSPIVSVDIPSGLFNDTISPSQSIEAEYTISFEIPKLCFLVPELASKVGRWLVTPIGLHPQYASETDCNYIFLTKPIIESIYRPKIKFGHKGTFGRALIIAGSYGMLGAAQLATLACLRAGPGLVSVHAPKCAYEVLQIGVPEALLSVDPHKQYFSSLPEGLSQFAAIGIGPGLGTSIASKEALEGLFKTVDVPIIIDADALNLIAQFPKLWDHLPNNSILTPHPGEFQRLFGKSSDSFVELELLQKQAKEKNCIIILKGAHTRIAFPDGIVYFNSTGNPGMATGGSGDVLTGIITGLLAQGYTPKESSLMGVYIHGKAGDYAAQAGSQETLIASDIIHNLYQVFKYLAS